MSTELYLMLVPRAGIEPATQNFSGFRSTIWAISIYGVTTGFDPYLGVSQTPVLPLHYCHHWKLADAVGFEPTKLHFNVTCFLSRKVISTSSSTHLYHSVLILLVLAYIAFRTLPGAPSTSPPSSAMKLPSIRCDIDLVEAVRFELTTYWLKASYSNQLS